MRGRGTLVLCALATAGLAAACIPVAPPPPVVQTCDPYWRSYVLPSDHNYAGIGAYPGSDRYMCKPTVRRGVRAQIQHLRNYADPTSVSTNLGAPFESRPKYDAHAFDTFVYKGAAPRWVDLEGRWAVPGTTYWDTIQSICNEMRAWLGLPHRVGVNAKIMGAPTVTAAQIGAYVRAVGNPWKPEVSPEAMAAVFLDEGRRAGVRGDVAFCQSILETGWFSWPSSLASVAATSAAETLDPTTTSTTTTSTTSTTTPGDDVTTTTSIAGDPTSTTTPSTTTTTAAPPPPEPAIDPVFAVYFELQRARARY